MAGAGYKLFNTGDVLTAAQVNTYLQEQTVMVFASSTARTTALTGVLAEGMVSYLQDTNAVEVYNGSAWVGVSGAGDVTEVQAGTGISVASGTGPIPVVTNTMATEITAAGDIVVGTGSGTFDNLPIGTTGQVLTADTTVSPYKVKWAAAGSAGALTKISRQTFSNVASYAFDSVFSSTYSAYLIVFEDVTAATQTDGLELQLRYSSTTETAGYYGCSADFDYGTTGSTLTGNQVGSNNAAQFTISRDLSASPDPKSTGFMYYIAPAATSKPSWHGKFLSGYLQAPSTFGGSQYSTSRAYDGILFKSASSNISGTIAIYGVSQ